MPAGAGLRPLPELEVEGGDVGHLVERPAESSRSQLVEVARVLGLLLGQHAALTGADAGSGPLGTPGQRHLGLLRQRPEAHVGHEDRHRQFERPLGAGPMTVVADTGSSSSSGRRASWAVTNWMSSHDGSSSV